MTSTTSVAALVGNPRPGSGPAPAAAVRSAASRDETTAALVGGGVA